MASVDLKRFSASLEEIRDGVELPCTQEELMNEILKDFSQDAWSTIRVKEVGKDYGILAVAMSSPLEDGKTLWMPLSELISTKVFLDIVLSEFVKSEQTDWQLSLEAISHRMIDDVQIGIAKGLLSKKPASQKVVDGIEKSSQLLGLAIGTQLKFSAGDPYFNPETPPVRELANRRWRANRSYPTSTAEAVRDLNMTQYKTTKENALKFGKPSKQDISF